EEPLVEPRVSSVERLQHLADRRPLHRHLRRTAGQRPQLRRDAHLDAHERPASSRSMASANASMVGLIVAVGFAIGATASIVFNPRPVTYATTRSSGRTTPARANLASVAIVTPPAVSAKMPSVRAKSRIPSTTSASDTDSIAP